MGGQPASTRSSGGHALTDFVVVGGGIAGVSAAAHLSPYGSVTLVEAEPILAYHTTGRSAALFIENYGSDGTRPLSTASKRFLEDPPGDFVDGPLLTDRGFVWVASEQQLTTVRSYLRPPDVQGPSNTWLSADDALDLVPVLRPEWVAGGLYEPAARDIDVSALHQAFVRIARSNGAQIQTMARVSRIRLQDGGWIVTAGGNEIPCGAVINAAGPWGDVIAEISGVQPVGLQPLRRTAFMVPGNAEYAEMPMVADGDEDFYFKPDGVQLLCSLSEETPDEPSDARPRTEDVALAIERINAATTLDIRTVNSEWTGLRTFAPDREMVIGEEPDSPGFFWLAGQGSTGIQTSPAYGSLLASLATGTGLSDDIRSAGVDTAVLSPARFR